MSKNSVHFQNSNFELQTAFHDRSGEAHIDILPKSAFDVQKGLYPMVFVPARYSVWFRHYLRPRL